MISATLGGVGLFLIGMVLVTDGLRAAAGDALRRFLLRFTGGPLRGVLSGALVTALVQSSSATTVATIGFVGAGLLGFEQAIGLILGANIGTTATGWIVALLGLKFSVSTAALPLVGVGALVRLFTRGRAADLGLALAGFGVIFVGIDILQTGMEGVAQQITPADLPQDTLGGRLALLALGVLLTAIMQSSSAAITTAMTALHSEAVSLEQAAAMVIGINIGTTITATMAAIGASTAARRTAFAHLLFNLLTGVVAFSLLPFFVWLVADLGERLGERDATALLAGFHTTFNLVGVALVLPFSKRFAALVERTIRQRGPTLTRLLDPRLTRQGTVATEAVRSTCVKIAGEVLTALVDLLHDGRLAPSGRERLDAAAAALRATEDYLSTLRFSDALSEEGHERHVSTIHALDHLRQLMELAQTPHLPAPDSEATLLELARALHAATGSLAAWLADPTRALPDERLRAIAEQASQVRLQLRQDLLRRTAEGSLTPAAAGGQLEALRWLDQTSHHMWRLADHLRGPTAGPAHAAEGAPDAA